MSFNTEGLISHKDLADYLGMTPRKLKGEIIKFETPLKMCSDANIAGEHVTYYNRNEALEWAGLWVQFDAIDRRARARSTEGRPKATRAAGQKVPPRTPTPFKPLQLGREMRIAYDRAEIQPPMITPNGYGDHARSWGGSRSEA